MLRRGKRAAETLCFDYHRQNNVDIRVARIYNTYGPGMHPYDGRVVSNFLVQAINGEDITVYGEGAQTRSFCFVDDLIDGLIKLMNQEETIGPVNIGNPGEFTIKQLAELAIKTTKVPPPLRPTHPARLVALLRPRLAPSSPRATYSHPFLRLVAAPPWSVRFLSRSQSPRSSTCRRPEMTRSSASPTSPRPSSFQLPKVPLEQGIVKAAEYFASLDLKRFKDPTKHTAHKNTEELEKPGKKQRTK